LSALPPVVVSGLPNMTPIFMRIWLMKKSAVGACHRAGELAERLAHEAGLEAHVAVAHFAFDFGLGHQRRHRVDDDEVDGAGAHSVSAISRACSP
jgi:hypothetical protein